MYLNRVTSKNFDRLGRLLENLGFSGVYHFEIMQRDNLLAEIVPYRGGWTIEFYDDHPEKPVKAPVPGSWSDTKKFPLARRLAA